mmetsp:Transcript_23729/g.61977  ORF Transcript_23729/g.61977 Transcript_23729/m.61977 type:complete len:139 (+) Transcript_23729:253-669(+)|eukprot:CAMPEP_0182915712 /NCGR_PEP_ID=MMETSP0105_2-20130417/496_1 /TAXON_ID=81532 ORGANISM="Acanthoeca-like sp., Strain 10tr" /NCGR_SAMPLE_ID=MMETSP0105_2 /ASSEMBLY_ACC=CAM_ASM_000205 /LENGTH=138 /DNA_ID=CAMNT_0025052597 /DNA_START=250 /DNA_END=666 /DNA_ORIENTATION=-
MNYKGLVALEAQFAGKPFKVLAFPCNQFLDQEPHSNSVVESFARGKGFKGPMFAKANVNGACTSSSGCQPSSTECCPANSAVWGYLESVSGVPGNGKIPWNFEKYLCGKDGVPLQRLGASDSPTKLATAIDKLLSPSA